MHLPGPLRFALKASLAGIALAIAAVLLFPELIQPPRPVVELKTSEATDATPVQAVESYADAVDLAAPAVVNIYTAKRVSQAGNPLLNDPLFRHFFGQPGNEPPAQVQNSLGSGVIVSTQGYILTNNHVVESADEIQVMLADGRSVAAQVVGSDPDTDLAVLSIALPDLPSLTLGDSKRLRVGDVVLAIGNPFGVGQTVTQGIVSATGRSQLGINVFEDFIQTDAAINPGNSGGALINPRGELIGINTAIFSQSGGSQGIGFAIPISLVRDVLQQIIEKGQVVRGWLGIETRDLTATLASSLGLNSTNGVLVAGVLRGGPADAAGLRPGDVLTAIDGAGIDSAYTGLKLIASHAPGSSVKLDGMREGRAFTTEARIGQRPARTQ